MVSLSCKFYREESIQLVIVKCTVRKLRPLSLVSEKFGIGYAMEFTHGYILSMHIPLLKHVNDETQSLESSFS